MKKFTLLAIVCLLLISSLSSELAVTPQMFVCIQSHSLCGCLGFYPLLRLSSPLSCSGDVVEIAGNILLILRSYLP